MQSTCEGDYTYKDSGRVSLTTTIMGKAPFTTICHINNINIINKKVNKQGTRVYGHRPHKPFTT